MTRKVEKHCPSCGYVMKLTVKGDNIGLAYALASVTCQGCGTYYRLKEIMSERAFLGESPRRGKPGAPVKAIPIETVQSKYPPD